MSIEFTAYVLSLPFDRQDRLWSGERPWRFEGVDVRFPPSIRLTSRDVNVTPEGALVRIKQVVERPCFGSPVAFLVHGGDRYGLGRNGKPYPLRCNPIRCPAAEACGHVAQRRLHANDDIRTSREEFELGGGIRELNRQRKDRLGGRALSAWGSLLRALKRHGPFACLNADMLRARADAHVAVARSMDAQRKRQERLAERAACIVAGSDDPFFLKELRLETSLRAIMFECARDRPRAPSWIMRCAANGAQFTAEVWRAKMLVEARGRKATAGSVARQMVADGLIEEHRENAQRNGAIKSALDRVHRLETVDWTGEGPTWQRISVTGLVEASEPLEPPARSTTPFRQSTSVHPLQPAN